MERPTWLDETAYPFQSRMIPVNGHELHYVDEGQGPLLLFVTAGPVWSFVNRYLIKDLRNDYRCVAVDPPLSGPSRAAPGFGNTIEENADAIAAFVRALDLQDATAVVHDLGGPITLRAATKDPGRYAGFVVMEAFGHPLGETPGVARVLRFVSGRLFGIVNRTFNVLPRVVSRFNGRAGPDPRRIRKLAYAGPMRDKERRNAFQRLFRDATRADALMRDVGEALRTTFSGLPFLLLYGAKSPAPRFGFPERLLKLVPHARYEQVPNARHFPQEDNPAAIVESVRAWHRPPSVGAATPRTRAPQARGAR